MQIHSVVCVILLAFSSQWCTVQAAQTKKCFMDQSAKGGGKCGNQLSQKLQIVCDAKYFRGYRQKRGKDNMTQYLAEGRRFLQKRSALSFLERPDELEMSAMERLQKRYQGGSSNTYQGLVCECCIHKCTVQELCQYCEEKYACQDQFAKYGITYF